MNLFKRIRKKFKKPYLFYLGNLMMVGAVAMVLFIYYPIASIYLFPEEVKLAEAASEEPLIIIPSIGAKAPIIENVNPWNSLEYNEALKKGVAQAEGTSPVGERGTIYLFAHSSGRPWEMTHNNTAFFRLGELARGDKIYVEKGGVRYTYKVSEKREVWPSEVEYLKKDQGDVLILQTCTPPGTSFKRLLVFAVAISITN